MRLQADRLHGQPPGARGSALPLPDKDLGVHK